jgi:hypothetical protein
VARTRHRRPDQPPTVRPCPTPRIGTAEYRLCSGRSRVHRSGATEATIAIFGIARTAARAIPMPAETGKARLAIGRLTTINVDFPAR